MIDTRLTGLLSHAKKYIVYNIFWQWISLLAQIGAVFSIAGLLGQAAILLESKKEEMFLAQGQNTNGLYMGQTLIVLTICVAVRFICEKLAVRASCQASVDVKQVLRKRIYRKMLSLGASYHEQVSTSEVMQVCTEGVEQLEIYFGKYLPQLFYSLLAPLTLFFVLMHISLRASAVLLICVPLIPVSIVAVQKLAKRLLNRYWSIYTGLGDSFLENLQGMTTLKIYQADEMKAKEMDKEAQIFRRITMKVLTMQLNSTSVMDIVAYGGAAAGMIVAASEFLAGTLSFAGALTIILLASEFFIPLRLLGSFFHIAMNGMAASDKIFRLIDLADGKTDANETAKTGERAREEKGDGESVKERAGKGGERMAAELSGNGIFCGVKSTLLTPLVLPRIIFVIISITASCSFAIGRSPPYKKITCSRAHPSLLHNLQVKLLLIV